MELDLEEVHMEKTKKSPFLQSAIIGIKLLLICAIVAAVVAFVYELTLETANANIEKTKSEKISEIFGIEGLTLEELSADDGPVVYAVTDADKKLIGYCAETASAGFGGDISILVGYNETTEIVGVRIVSMSETPGLGSKIDDPEGYLKNYVGKLGVLELNEDVDAISGATISSTALMDGVNQATKALQKALGAEGGAQ